MHPALPFKLLHEGQCISDIHRKLASIREQLRAQLKDDPGTYQFLCADSTLVFDQQMANAINAFKRTFRLTPDDDGICDEQTWERLNEEAGSVYSEVWQYELDALQLRIDSLGARAPGSAPVLDPSGTAAPAAEEKLPRPRAAAVEFIRAGVGSAAPLKVRPANEDAVIAAAHQAQLAGLAFSGGGIRSATFNLGILQALAERDILGHFDYLSTVSGGGYIGAWFSKWLKREQGDVGAVSASLSPGTRDRPVQREPDEIGFLRQYSNYLTPRTGLFSADTWALLATYFRNTALNMTILVALLGALLIVPRLLGFFAAAYGKDHRGLFAWLAAATALWAVFVIALSVSSRPDPVKQQWRRGQTQGSILALVVAPLLVSAFFSSIAVWHYSDRFDDIWHRIPPHSVHPVLTWIVLPGIAYFAAWASGWLLAQWHNRDQVVLPGSTHGAGGKLGWLLAQWRDQDPHQHQHQHQGKLRPRMLWQGLREALGHFLCALVALGVGMLMLTWAVSAVRQWPLAVAMLDGPAQGMLLVSYGMPFMLSIFGIAMILAIGLVGRMYNDQSREWWSRQGGWTAICTLAWFALTAVSLYAPPILGYLYAHLFWWSQALLGSAWLGSTVGGLLLGHGSATGKRDSSPSLEWIAAVAPLIFSVGALFLVSTLVYFMMLPSASASGWGGAGYFGWNDAFNHYFAGASRDIDAARAGIVLLCLAVAGAGLARRVDVNKFSLYMMYRNRLVRAYLGASNTGRNPHPFTGFDKSDDMHLDSLLATGGVIQRPYPIINATLNLVAGKELAWQTRKAAGFSFTPGFCGFELPSMVSAGHAHVVHEAERGSFRPTAGYRTPKGALADEEAGVKLGMAVAVSGAAVSPNMGYHSSPALSFLMTLFNVRLGRWFANPRRASWALPAPKFGVRYLLAELFGMSDANARFVYLSDGGHFENLGIYELVRRRCKLIVVIDASADGQLNFEDLGNAIRKCATDLHIEIDIDARQIVPQLPDEFSRAHCVVGNILYERIDPGAENGTLLYIKPSLLATEYAEVLSYRKVNKSFPHQSTADQWFDETQFESYRSLGYRIGLGVFAPPQGDNGATPGHPVSDLAAALKKTWGNGDAATCPVAVAK